MKAHVSATPARIALVVALALGLSACKIFSGSGDKHVTPTLGNRTPILSHIENGAKVDPALAGIAVVLPPPEVNTDWAQPGGNANKSYGHLALASDPKQVWTQDIAGSSTRRRLAAAPVIGGGTLYVVGTDAVIHAYDAQTGSPRWSHAMKVPEGMSAASFGGGVSFAEGKVYATDGAGDVIALNAADGSELWNVRPAGPLRGSPTIAFGSVYVMTQDNKLIALDTTDGSLKWQKSGSATQTGVFGVAAPAAGQGTVIAGYASGELIAYRYENGRELWTDALARTSISTEVGSLTDIDADPIIDSGRVYALGQGGRMAAYELVTGQRIWELNLAGISTPAVAGEWIFTLTDEGKLLAIARNSGKVRWIADLPRYKNMEKKKNAIYWTGPVLAGNQLWVGNSRGELWRVSVGEGAASKYLDLDSPISIEPVVAQSTLYVLTDDGKIHALR